MKAEKNKKEGTVYNFLTENKLLMILSGHYLYQSPMQRYLLNLTYIGLVGFLIIAFTTSSLVAVYVSLGDTVETIHTFHLFLLNAFILGGLLCRVICDQLLTDFVTRVELGVYKYSGEPEDEDHNDIKRRGVKEIRSISMIFTKFLFFSAISNTLYVSGSQWYLIAEDTSSKPLNPYLPQPFYFPFNTRTTIGFCVAFSINIIYMFYLCSICVVMDEIYLSCAIQVRNQFEILNDSINKIERRAILKLTSTEDIKIADTSVNDLYMTNKFQKCLYYCLRANVQHHHEILSLMYKFDWYAGACLLMISIMASVILAMQIVLILENPGLNVMLNFVVTLIAEFIYILHYCWFGELLTQESKKTYNVLFWTPWAHCSKQFKQLLIIMMICTKTPVKINTVGFGISASLETLGSIITTMYQVMNVARGNKK